jgi:glutamate formiminotransferase
MSWLECVPNFSEGRDPAKVNRIADPARTVPGVVVLDVESNADHNRSVITLVGEGPALIEAVLGMMRVATETIDLTQHHGEHPRIGATDVVPFVPLEGTTMDEAVQLAVRLGERVAKELHIPVYLYGNAARRPERSELPNVRTGEFEGLREAIATDPARAPDFGEAKVHPTAGAVAIGARPVLIAYNAYLTTPDVGIAKKIAKSVRARDGGLPEVRALGFEIKERNRAQVSMNLTDYHRTPIHRALEFVRREAARYGVGIEESEVVGLVPEEALFEAAEYYLQLNRFDRASVLERKVRAASAGGSASEPIDHFLERLAARTPTPGGGTAAAAAGALGAALGEMVLAYSVSPTAPADPEITSAHGLCYEARRMFLVSMDEDSRSYEAVRSARRALKEAATDPERQRNYRAALENAARVPLETARLAVRIRSTLATVGPKTRVALKSDLITARSLLSAAKEGALANVSINLADLQAAGENTQALEAEVQRLDASE